VREEGLVGVHGIEGTAFVLSMAVLVWTARQMLRSWTMAAVAVVPIAAAPVFAVLTNGTLAPYSQDAVIGLALGCAFAIWLASHITGEYGSMRTIVIVALACGFAGAFKPQALLEAAAFAFYLGVYSRGRRRVLYPLAVAGLVVGVSIAVNPSAAAHIWAGVWDAGVVTMLRPLVNLKQQIEMEGPCTAVRLLTDSFFWWPIFPAAVFAVWSCRRERWFPPAAILGTFLALGEALCFLELSCQRYVEFTHLGFFFLISVSLASAYERFAGRKPDGLESAPAGQAAGDANGPTERAAEARQEGPVAVETTPVQAPAATGERPSRARRLLGPVSAMASLVFVLSIITVQAVESGTLFLDEPLWFMRSRVLPYDVSNEDYRHWAIDAPGLNRWIYWTVLHLTDLDQVPQGEESPWSMRNGRIFWKDKPIPRTVTTYYSDKQTLDSWVGYAGRYAPRKAILAMRATNIASFGIYLVLVWLGAFTVLRSYGGSTAAVLPIALSPAVTIPFGLSFYVWSGDVFMVTAMSAAFLAWLRYHLRQRGTTAGAVAVVALFIGLAAASKQHALLMLWAFMVYLAWGSTGWRRATNPILAAAIALAVYTAINPVIVLYPGAYPWDVVRMIVERRIDVVHRFVTAYGRFSVVDILRYRLYWFPIFPAACLAVWACRRERWFAPVFLFGVFLTVGTGLGFFQTGKADVRYAAPLELGLFFLVSVCVVTVARGARLTQRRSADGQSPAGNTISN